jgi:hypothetical protein
VWTYDTNVKYSRGSWCRLQTRVGVWWWQSSVAAVTEKCRLECFCLCVTPSFEFWTNANSWKWKNKKTGDDRRPFFRHPTPRRLLLFFTNMFRYSFMLSSRYHEATKTSSG